MLPMAVVQGRTFECAGAALCSFMTTRLGGRALLRSPSLCDRSSVHSSIFAQGMYRLRQRRVLHAPWELDTRVLHPVHQSLVNVLIPGSPTSSRLVTVHSHRWHPADPNSAEQELCRIHVTSIRIETVEISRLLKKQCSACLGAEHETCCSEQYCGRTNRIEGS